MFLRKYISRTKFSKVFPRESISLTKSNVYFGCNFLCKKDDVYKSFVHIFVRELVTNGSVVNGLVTNGSDFSTVLI